MKLPLPFTVLSLSVALLVPAEPAAAGGEGDAAFASADPAGAGALDGHVSTADGLALPGVRVELRNGGDAVQLTTGPDGSFRASGLPPGEYSVRVDAPGLVLRDPAAVLVGPRRSPLVLVLDPAPVSERLVVSATRGEAAASTLGVSADVLDRERIERRAAVGLASLLEEVPGVATTRTGGAGAQSSAFVRGGESRFARVLVDGVPLNQPGGAYDLGTALPFELERVEVVRGAASSLYGSDALAGVVSLTTRRAREGEAPSVRAEGEGGGFAWRRFAAGTTGTRGSLDWNAGAQRLLTDNEQPNSAFEETSLALSLGLRLSDATEARSVLRFDDGNLGTPGPTALARPDLDASFERRDLAGSVSLRRSGTGVVQQVSLSHGRTRQLSLDPLDSGSYTPEWHGVRGAYALSDYPDPAGFQNQTARSTASYQADLALGARDLLTIGGEAEHQTSALGSRSAALLHPDRSSFGLFVQDRRVIGSRVYLTFGGRVEHNGSYGTRAVPRAALAWRLREGGDGTTLRASAGMGIKEPSLLESFGNLFTRANPDLDPERSTTFDLGLEQRLLGSRLRLAATAFQHEYRDQIAYTMVDPATYEGMYVNLARTRSRGLELSAEAQPLPSLQLAAQYTLQDGRILESPSDFDPVYEPQRPLLRRPRHQGSLSASYALFGASLGATLVRVGARADSDFSGIGLASDPAFRNPAYTRLDARLRVPLAGRLEAFAAADNLLDARYEAVLGYPALGRALRAGVRLSLRPRS